MKKLNAQLDKKDVIVKRYDTCKICSFDKGVDLRKNLEENHTHKCSECEDVLFTKDRLESHIRIYHIWDCDLCDFTADTDENLEEHKVTCHEHECYYCDFETTDAKDLTRHIEEDHSNKCPNSISCGQCRQTCISRYCLMRYMRKKNMLNEYPRIFVNVQLRTNCMLQFCCWPKGWMRQLID